MRSAEGESSAIAQGRPDFAAPRVAVIGGSIGGLHTALVLRDLGCEVQVFERSSESMSSRGAGIVVQEESVHYLENRGIARREEISTVAHSRLYLNRAGGMLREMPMFQRFTAWNTLYEALRGAFPDEHYHQGAEFTDYRMNADSVTACFADGTSVLCDLLVCADGISSTARSLLDPESIQRYAGYVAWRGLVREADVPPAIADPLRERFTFFEYPNSHMLCYLVPGANGQLSPGERRLNWVWYVNVPEGPALDRLLTDRTGARREFSVPPGDVPGDLVEELNEKAREDLPPLLQDLVRHTPEPFLQPIVDVAVSRMADERICLLGDAAFAPRPHTAASTAKACANGFALAEALVASKGDVRRALQLWEPPQLQLGQQLKRRGQLIAAHGGLGTTG